MFFDLGHHVIFMNVVFLSNYFNHHQKPLSDNLYNLLKENYIFIETEKMSDERIKLGWSMENKPTYVKQSWNIDINQLYSTVDNADVVIIGSAPNELISNRIKNKKIVLRYSERIFKKNPSILKYPIRLIKWNIEQPSYLPIYMLCASGYTASDYKPYHMYINKTYKWGYFPETIKYENINDLIRKKETNSILWTARFIDWKHPEVAIEIAERLKKDGYSFKLNMIGNGGLEDEIKELIQEKELEDYVEMLGGMKPEKVREYMEKSEIFIFTSDRNEGWGAVLNESMNSGCAVVANKDIGSVPFLIKENVNGFVYKDKNIDDLYHKVKQLIDNKDTREKISKEAYNTIVNKWNAENAAIKLIQLCRDLIKTGTSKRFEDGPCSKV